MSKLHRTLVWTIDEWIRENWHDCEVGEHVDRWEQMVRAAITAGKLGALCRFADLIASDPQLCHVGSALVKHDLDPTAAPKEDGEIINPAMRESNPNRIAGNVLTGYRQTGEPNPDFKPTGES